MNHLQPNETVSILPLLIVVAVFGLVLALIRAVSSGAHDDDAPQDEDAPHVEFYYVRTFDLSGKESSANDCFPARKRHRKRQSAYWQPEDHYRDIF